MNQTIFWSLFILALFVWLAFRPFATAPWKILGAFGLLLLLQPLTVIALKTSDRLHPLKYDYVLQSIDQTLGLTAFQVARLFSPAEDERLLIVYELLSAAMIIWYGVHLVLRTGESRQVLGSYLILFPVGAALYGIVPALGPRYVFGAMFPAGTVNATPILVALTGYPNAMPSLHVATAMLLLLFTCRNRWLLATSVIFFALTVAATLALEHYVVDLVVAMPFACFAATLARRRFDAAAGYLALVLAWLLLIRFASAELIRHPWGLRSLALFSAFLGVRAVVSSWSYTSERSLGKSQPVPAAD